MIRRRFVRIDRVDRFIRFRIVCLDYRIARRVYHHAAELRYWQNRIAGILEHRLAPVYRKPHGQDVEGLYISRTVLSERIVHQIAVITGILCYQPRDRALITRTHVYRALPAHADISLVVGQNVRCILRNLLISVINEISVFRPIDFKLAGNYVHVDTVRVLQEVRRFRHLDHKPDLACV